MPPKRENYQHPWVMDNHLTSKCMKTQQKMLADPLNVLVEETGKY